MKTTSSRRAAKKSQPRAHAEWDLRLYIADDTQWSVVARSNLQKLCEAYLKDRYRLEVIDIVKDPLRARADQIFAVPMLVRCMATASKKILGDLSNTERVLAALGVASGRCESTA